MYKYEFWFYVRDIDRIFRAFFTFNNKVTKESIIADPAEYDRIRKKALNEMWVIDRTYNDLTLVDVKKARKEGIY